ncbi:unnamed protein product, partial [Nesidiocoris tenuis]
TNCCHIFLGLDARGGIFGRGQRFPHRLHERRYGRLCAHPQAAVRSRVANSSQRHYTLNFRPSSCQTPNATETQTHNQNRSQSHNETETPTQNRNQSQTHNETELQRIIVIEVKLTMKQKLKLIIEIEVKLSMKRKLKLIIEIEVKLSMEQKLKLIIEVKLSMQQKLKLEVKLTSNYVLNYLATRPKLSTFVVQALVTLYARITKLGWFDHFKDDLVFRNVINDIANFLQVRPHFLKNTCMVFFNE